MDWVGLGQSADGLGWIGSHKMDPWTNLIRLVTAKKIHEWVLNKAAWSKEGTVRHRQSKEASILYGHTMKKQGCCLEKEIMQGTMPGARRRGRPRTAWMDNMKTWTGLSVEESIRMTEINGESTSMGVTNPRIEGSRTANEQNRTVTPAAVKVTLRRTASTVT